MLDISRIEAGRISLDLECVRPFEVMQAAIELISPLAAKREIDLLPPPLSDARWSIEADRQRLMQVFVNLLGSAVKYNRERGQVRVSFEETPGSRLRIKIADTGPGIAGEQLKRLFVPFERLGADRSGIEGTGLGLSYSNRLMTAMGGSIGVESEVGKGSVFWVETQSRVSEYSKRDDSLPVKGSLTDKEINGGLGGGTVLCIQNDASGFRELEGIFDRLQGYKIVSAELGRIGLRMAEEHLPELVIVDHELPDMDGIEVLKELRSRASLRKTPLVLVSSVLTEETKRIALDAGAQSCVPKPIQTLAFLDAIECLI